MSFFESNSFNDYLIFKMFDSRKFRGKENKNIFG